MFVANYTLNKPFSLPNSRSSSMPKAWKFIGHAPPSRLFFNIFFFFLDTNSFNPHTITRGLRWSWEESYIVTLSINHHSFLLNIYDDNWGKLRHYSSGLVYQIIRDSGMRYSFNQITTDGNMLIQESILANSTRTLWLATQSESLFTRLEIQYLHRVTMETNEHLCPQKVRINLLSEPGIPVTPVTLCQPV